jgi:putative ABC transport system permease protein
MNRRFWFMGIVVKSLVFRPGRSLLLLGVLTMAASLVTALGMVSSAMKLRVAEEVRKYGANLVLTPATAAIEVGSGGLDFGSVAETAYLSRQEIARALTRVGIDTGSFHLRGQLIVAGSVVPAEGVDFQTIRALYPWWQLQGGWPAFGEGVVGTDLAARLQVKAGNLLRVTGPGGSVDYRISAVLVTGGEEDRLLFIPLERLQELMGLGDSVSQVRLLARTGTVPLEKQAAGLEQLLPGSRVREVRQVARTSEGLLKKVQLLMALVTGVVVIASASSVASTMSMTVLERSKEIGLLKAVGGSRREVLSIFSAEALLLGITGGVAGFLCGSLIALFVMKSVFSASAGFAPPYLLPALLVSLLISLGGSMGAMLAVFRLDPVRSLRGE